MTYIIAEIGINHNGSLETAFQLIDLAVEAGCDAVKFQKRSIDIVYSSEYLSEKRESPWERHKEIKNWVLSSIWINILR